MEDKIIGIGVAGFKSAMKPVRINVRDVTVLAGANSAGKSTVIQPLLMIKQSLEKPFDAGGLAIDGPLVKFTNADQFLFAGGRGTADKSLHLEIKTGKKDFFLTYKKSEDGPITPTEMRFRISEKEVIWKPGQTFSADDPSLSFDSFIGNLKISDSFIVERTGCWLSARVNSSQGFGLYGAITPASAPMRDIQSMIHLPGLRGNPERDYNISAVGPAFPGNFSDYIASVIHNWTEKKHQNIDMLNNSLRRLGLTWKVTTKRLDDTRVEIRVGRLPTPAQGGAHDTVSIADVGFGVSQTLPVLVALIAARRGQIVSIEQPEIHLHPRAQTILAELILEAADRGVRVIIETHSSLLLLAIQSLISEDRLAPERASLNWFTRDGTGQTHVTEAKLAPDGSYGDWPVDFGAVEMEAQSRYLDLFDRKHPALDRAV